MRGVLWGCSAFMLVGQQHGNCTVGDVVKDRKAEVPILPFSISPGPPLSIAVPTQPDSVQLVTACSATTIMSCHRHLLPFQLSFPSTRSCDLHASLMCSTNKPANVSNAWTCLLSARLPCILQVMVLMAELGRAGAIELGIQLNPGVVERLMSYAESVAHFPTAVKEVCSTAKPDAPVSKGATSAASCCPLGPATTCHIRCSMIGQHHCQS